MKTDLQHKLTLGMLSLPRSGSTIITQFFNSLDDGVGFCEPLPTQIRWDRHNNLGKLGYGTTTYDSVYRKIVARFKPTIFNLLFIKEVYTPNRAFCTKVLEYPFNRHVFLFRNPLDVWASGKIMHWPKYDLNAFYQSYIDIAYWADQYIQAGKETRIIIYEEFLANPIACINRVLGSDFKVMGDLNLRPMDNICGDSRANKSTTVVAGQNKRNALKPEDLRVCNELMSLFEQMCWLSGYSF